MWRFVRGLRQESGKHVATILERLTSAYRTNIGQYVISPVINLKPFQEEYRCARDSALTVIVETLILRASLPT